MSNTESLPPLPAPAMHANGDFALTVVPYFSAEQMHAYAQAAIEAQPAPAEPPYIRDFWRAAVRAGDALAASGTDGKAFCDALDRLTEAILHPEDALRSRARAV